MNEPQQPSAEDNDKQLAILRAALDSFQLGAEKKDTLAARFLRHIRAVQTLEKRENWDNIEETIHAAVNKISELNGPEKRKIAEYAIRELQSPRYKKRIQLTAEFLDFDGKINELTSRFKAEGLSRERLVKAVCNQPRILLSVPEHCEGNIRGLVEKFADEGLTVAEYLDAALKRPLLFCREPETIEANIKHMIELNQQGLLSIKLTEKAAPKGTLRGPNGDLLTMLMRNGGLLTNSIDNIDMHVAFGLVTGQKVSTSLLLRTKKETVKQLGEYLGTLSHPLHNWTPAADQDEVPKTTIATNSAEYGEMLLVRLAKQGKLGDDLNKQVLEKAQMRTR